METSKRRPSRFCLCSSFIEIPVGANFGCCVIVIESIFLRIFLYYAVSSSSSQITVSTFTEIQGRTHWLSNSTCNRLTFDLSPPSGRAKWEYSFVSYLNLLAKPFKYYIQRVVAAQCVYSICIGTFEIIASVYSVCYFRFCLISGAIPRQQTRSA